MSSLDLPFTRVLFTAGCKSPAELNRVEVGESPSLPVGSLERRLQVGAASGVPSSAMWNFGCDKDYNRGRISTSPSNSLLGVFLLFLTTFGGQSRGEPAFLRSLRGT